MTFSLWKKNCPAGASSILTSINKHFDPLLADIRDMAASGDVEGARHDFRLYQQRLRFLMNEFKLICDKHGTQFLRVGDAPRNPAQCCFGIKRHISAHLAERERTVALLERFAGEERMRSGMFGGLGDLGRLQARARRRRPTCRRVWVSGYSR